MRLSGDALPILYDDVFWRDEERLPERIQIGVLGENQINLHLNSRGTTAVLSPTLVRARITNFWGYGSFEAPTWFVGMEEGLESDVTLAHPHLNARFRAADGKPTIDMRNGMERVPGHIRWFNPDGA
jgi:hypothetical protein